MGYKFPHITYPYSSCIFIFCISIPTFCVFKKMFFVLVPVLFCNKILGIEYIFRAVLTHIQATTGVPRQPYEGLHIMFYTRRCTHK